MMRIKEFRGEYEFLSNFYEHPFVYNGQAFRNSEAAFQAQKTLDPAERLKFSAMSASESKRAGRRVTLRPDWEQVKDQVMRAVLMAKFADPTLKKKLVRTIGIHLIEGNTWHDNYWGSCTCTKCGDKGQNVLGKLLREVRHKYREEVMTYDRYEMTSADVQAKKQLMEYDSRLMRLARNQNNIDLDMEEDCIAHLWQDGCGDQYILMAHEIAARGFKKVIDIGCCTGYQYLYFKAHGIEMMGIDIHPFKGLEPAPIRMETCTYPHPLHEIFDYDPEETVGVSSLCMSYLGDIEPMFRQAAKDFKYLIITLNRDKMDIVEKYFHLEKVERDIYWLTSRGDPDK